MRRVLVGLAAASMLACVSRPAPSVLDGIAPDELLPAIERRLAGAKSVRVQFEVKRTYDFGGLPVQAAMVRFFLPGDSRGSLTVLRNGGYALSDSMSIAGSSLPMEVISDGSRVRGSGGFPGRTRNATTAETPGAREHVLRWLVLKGAEVGLSLGGDSADRIDGASGFATIGAKLGPIRAAGPHRKPARSLEYTLHEAGSRSSAEVTLWIDAETGLPIERETVVLHEKSGDAPRGGRTITRESYEITLDRDAPEAFSLPPDDEPASSDASTAVTTPIAAEALYREMEHRLVEARTVEVDMKSGADSVRLYLQGSERVLLRAPRLTIRSDGAEIVYSEDGAHASTSVPAPEYVTRQMATAFARGGYVNLSDVVRAGVVKGGEWPGTALTQFRWIRSEEVFGKRADVIRYDFEGTDSSKAACTLWIDSANRMPLKREIVRRRSGATQEVYTVVRLNAKQ